MSTKIILSESYATTVREVVEKTIPLEEFLEACQTSSCLMTGILPMGTKMISFSNNHIGLVIECPPCVRHFTYEIKNDIIVHRIFQLFFPWTYFIVSCEANPNRINSVSWFFARNPIKSKNSMIGHMAIPNTSIERDGLGNICLGNVHVEDNDAYEIGPLIDQFVTCLWGSAFNQDLFQWRSEYGIRKFQENKDFDALSHKLGTLDKLKDKEEYRFLTETINHKLGDVLYLMEWEKESLAANMPAKTMFLEDKNFKFPLEEKLKERILRSNHFRDMDWV